MARASKKVASATTEEPETPEVTPVAETSSAAKKGAWVSFTEEPPPRKERFVYCRELESGSRVAAFAEVSESSDGLGLFVDGIAGIQPMPRGEGHWWRVISLPK